MLKSRLFLNASRKSYYAKNLAAKNSFYHPQEEHHFSLPEWWPNSPFLIRQDTRLQELCPRKDKIPGVVIRIVLEIHSGKMILDDLRLGYPKKNVHRMNFKISIAIVHLNGAHKSSASTSLKHLIEVDVKSECHRQYHCYRTENVCALCARCNVRASVSSRK